MGTRAILTAILTLGATACGGSSSSPSSPSAPTTPVDLTGTWRESTGGDITWQLVQSGSNVSGTSQYSDQGFPGGAITGQGRVTGTVADGTFTFTDNSSSVSMPNCSIAVNGTMTLSGNTQMSGRYNETDTCNGAVVRSKSGNFVMRR